MPALSVSMQNQMIWFTTRRLEEPMFTFLFFDIFVADMAKDPRCTYKRLCTVHRGPGGHYINAPF